MPGSVCLSKVPGEAVGMMQLVVSSLMGRRVVSDEAPAAWRIPIGGMVWLFAYATRPGLCMGRLPLYTHITLCNPSIDALSRETGQLPCTRCVLQNRPRDCESDMYEIIW